MATLPDLHGFEVEAVPLPVPLEDFSRAARDTMAHLLAAWQHGDTPEAMAGYLTDGFPATVTDALARPYERAEVDAVIDLLLVARQAQG